MGRRVSVQSELGSSFSGKIGWREKKKIGGRDKDGDLNADNVPAESREVVQSLKEIVNRSEQEVYAMLVECDMDADEAVNRLLSQDSFQKVKRKRDKKKQTKDTTDSLSQRVDNSIQDLELRNGGDHYAGQGGENKSSSDETSNEQGTHNNLAGSSTTSGILGRIPPLNSDLKNVETKRVPISSSEAVPSLLVPSSRHQLARGCGTSGQRKMGLSYIDVVKMDLGSSKESVNEAPVKDDCPFDDEDEDVINPFSNSCIEYAARRYQLQEPASVSSQNSHDEDVANPFSNSSIEGDARSDQLGESALVSNQNFCDDDLSYFYKSIFGGDARRNLLQESALLCDEDNNKNDETYHLQRRSFEHNLTIDPSASGVTSLQQLSVETEEPEASVKEDKPVLVIPSHLQVKTSELSHLMFGRFGSGMNGSCQPTGLPSRSLNEESEDVTDFADDLSLKHLNLSDGEFHEEEEQLVRRNVANEQIADQINSNETVVARENQYKISSATDFTFDNSQRLYPVVAPSQPSLQMQNFNTFPDAMPQQVYKREPDSRYSAFLFNQSMPTKQNATTASSLGRRPSISMTEALRTARTFEPQMNQQPVNHHYTQPKVSTMPYGNTVNYPHSQPARNGGSNNNTYHDPSLDEIRRIINMSGLTDCFDTSSGNTANSQPTVPSGNYGNMLNYPHSRPTQNDNMLPSAFQQNGGRNNNTYLQQSLAAMLRQYRNSNLPQSAPAIVPSAYGSTNGSVNGFGLSSDNAANSRFGYESVLSSQFNGSNHLPSTQHQNGNSNIWSPQGHKDSRVNSGNDYYSLFSDHQNQQSQSLRQQEPEPYREIDYERSGLSFYNSYLNQQNSRRDPSDQTQQQPWPRNNH